MCPTHVRLHFVAKAAMTAMALGMIMTAGVAAPVAAEQAELVKAVSVRQDMTVYRGRLYFQGMDGIDHADEPWVSGGTPSTTRMIKDVDEGQGSSYPGAFIGAGDVVWFTVQNPQQRSLWRTQGTSATTRILDHKDEMVGRPRFANGSTLFFQGTKDDYPTDGPRAVEDEGDPPNDHPGARHQPWVGVERTRTGGEAGQTVLLRGQRRQDRSRAVAYERHARLDPAGGGPMVGIPRLEPRASHGGAGSVVLRRRQRLRARG